MTSQKLNVSLASLSRAAFGQTKEEAAAKNICVKCSKPPTEENIRTEAERREFKISGMCGPCFDALFNDED